MNTTTAPRTAAKSSKPSIVGLNDHSVQEMRIKLKDLKKIDPKSLVGAASEAHARKLSEMEDRIKEYERSK